MSVAVAPMLTEVGPVLSDRTPYDDHDATEHRRHLVRLWFRAGDRRQFRG